MTLVASGIFKSTAWKRQTALGTAATGTGGKAARRTSSIFKADRDTFASNEIVSHRQSTGVAYGLKKAAGKIDGLLSAGTWSDFFASLSMRDFAAVTPAAAPAATTVALVSGSAYTITRGAGSWLTDGLKVGNVVRITGSGIAAANVGKNLAIIALTATVCTVSVLNYTTLTPEGPIATYVLTVVGKTTYAPTTGQTKDYYSVEEWYSDLTKSELFTDCRVAQMAVNMPATGNATVSTDLVGLNRALATSQVLTTPTLTTTSFMTSDNGAIFIGGSVSAFATGCTINMSNAAENAGAVIGSNMGQDVTAGKLMVSGTITAQFSDTVLQALYNAEAVTTLNVIVTADETATADFVSFMLSRIKLTGDAPDDSEKVIIRTYPFTAEINMLGGAGTCYDQTIISINDSAA
jgi:hypothetical protein